MKYVLIVGGAGYIGSFATRALSKEYHCIVLDSLISGFKKNIEKIDNVTFIEGSIENKDLLLKIFNQYSFTCVFHFSAFINVGESTQNPKKYYDNNVLFTINLLNTMIEFDCKNFIFSSTAAVYGEPLSLPIDTQHPTNPINPYGNTKLIVEIAIKDYAKSYNFNYGILRYFNVCGASKDGLFGDRKYPAQHFIPILLYSILEKTLLSVFGNDYNTTDGTCIRDYIDIEDLIQAHLNSLTTLLNEKKSHTINLGTGKGYSVKELIHLSQEITKKKVNYKISPRREGDPSKLYTSYDEALKIIDWQPKHDISDSIESTWRWLCSQQKK